MVGFALSFWAMVTAGVTIVRDALSVSLLLALRLVSAAGTILLLLIFYPLWMLLPLIRSGEHIDSLYSIFMLDFCLIMPDSWSCPS